MKSELLPVEDKNAKALNGSSLRAEAAPRIPLASVLQSPMIEAAAAPLEESKPSRSLSKHLEILEPTPASPPDADEWVAKLGPASRPLYDQLVAEYGRETAQEMVKAWLEAHPVEALPSALEVPPEPPIAVAPEPAAVAKELVSDAGGDAKLVQLFLEYLRNPPRAKATRQIVKRDKHGLITEIITREA